MLHYIVHHVRVSIINILDGEIQNILLRLKVVRFNNEF
jgi:hypothetical protein